MGNDERLQQQGTEPAQTPAAASSAIEHLDVIIVGAGISGVSAAHHIKEGCPGRSFALLEGRERMGGTWDLFRYPGIRSDSDMHTLGFQFRPWRDAKAIADGPSIRKYVKATANESGLTDHLRLNHKVVAANFDEASSRWHVTVDNAGTLRELTCNVLFMCGGYYSYKGGYTPEFKGRDSYTGQVIHPQQWPEDLDYSGKKVLVIGSGATAMTLVPAMTDKAAKVTMLQRSPTYVVSRSDEDPIANFLRKILPEKLAYRLTRWKNIQMQRYIFNRTKTHPAKVKAKLIDLVREQLGDDYDVEKHFTPSYNPWDQRLCLVPNADLFTAIKSGKAEVVTEHIEGFVAEGVRLKNGEVLSADIIVTATGLNLEVLGGASFSVNNVPVNFSETFSYKGMMYSDVPNLVQTFGYINASWTLRADLTSEYVVRLLNHMSEHDKAVCTPVVAAADVGMSAKPWITDFPAGYMMRSMHLFPKQGDRQPWLNTQNFAEDRKTIRNSPLEDGSLIFTSAEEALSNTAAARASLHSDAA